MRKLFFFQENNLSKKYESQNLHYNIIKKSDMEITTSILYIFIESLLYISVTQYHPGYHDVFVL